jgi:hypothetical protein
MRFDIIRLDPHGLLILRDCFWQFPYALEDRSQISVCLGMVVVDTQRLLLFSHGRRRVAFS